MTPAQAAGWPFWAATTDTRIDEALRLSGLRAGERFVDLGCGDGRVLVRAAACGAVVAGVELDPDLAEQARVALAVNGLDGEVMEADFDDVPVAAEVVFAFLSPATLQRLRPRFEALAPGSRVVTTGYAVPGWVPDDVGDRCFVYRIPPNAAVADPETRGWISDGALVSLPPDAPSLVAVRLAHPGGAVALSVDSGGLGQMLTVRAGADRARPGDQVTVDLRFDPAPAGTSAAGTLLAEGVPTPFCVFAVADPGETGIWGLSAAGCRRVADLMDAGDLGPFLVDARRR